MFAATRRRSMDGTSTEAHRYCRVGDSGTWSHIAAGDGVSEVNSSWSSSEPRTVEMSSFAGELRTPENVVHVNCAPMLFLLVTE